MAPFAMVSAFELNRTSKLDIAVGNDSYGTKSVGSDARDL
jgi:hypothetical protein